jgi:ribosomal protein L11 methyltransferase
VKPGPLIRVSIATTAEADETVAEVLSELTGRSASSHTDLERGTTHVSVYLPGLVAWTQAREAALRRRLSELRRGGVPVGSGALRVRRIRREDWAESWKRHFRPIAIGEALLVRPSWSRRRARRGQAVVVLDPGLSFGTGQHPTTRFCLECLVEARRRHPRQSFLDIGTGSGILAIAAAKLGFKPVTAFDNDPDAVRIAQRNSARNRVSGKLKLTRQDLTQLKGVGAADVVCANLIDELLLSERRRIRKLVCPGGMLVLAGILKSQFEPVAQAFTSMGFKLMRQRREGEWESGAFCAP